MMAIVIIVITLTKYVFRLKNVDKETVKKTAESLPTKKTAVVVMAFLQNC